VIDEMTFEQDASTTDPRDRKTYYYTMTPFRRVVTPTARAVFWFMANFQAQGAENLPRSGPVIVASNHLNNYDVFPLQFALSRPIFFMGKAELFHPDWLDAGLRRMGGFPVVRGEGDAWAMQHAERVLAHNQVLGMFPEGTRSRGRGLRTAKTGVARLAITTGAPVVPAAIHGVQYMFRHFPRRTRVRVSIGEPIYPERGETHLGLTERIMFAMADMLPPEARGVYRHHPPGF
jgi:1-acyl-sn-glycerol-3-phosphate acyltransferase